VAGCPKSYIVNVQSGKCIYEEYVEHINAKYALVLGIVIGNLVVVAALFCLYQKYCQNRRLKYEIESHLAVALAQAHTLDKEKSQREIVEIGVGSNR
jgi:hypothetical protein